MLAVVFPVANIHIPIKVNQSTIPMIHSIIPPPIISSAIGIYLHTSSVFPIIHPLSFVEVFLLISDYVPHNSVPVSIVWNSLPVEIVNAIEDLLNDFGVVM